MVFSSKALFIPSSWGVFTNFLQVLQFFVSLLWFFRQKNNLIISSNIIEIRVFVKTVATTVLQVLAPIFFVSMLLTTYYQTAEEVS